MTVPDGVRWARFRRWMLPATVAYVAAAVIYLGNVLEQVSREVLLVGICLSLVGLVLNGVALVSLRSR